MGISSSELEDFCRCLGQEVRWDVLLLQEFCFTNDEFDNTSGDFLVFAQPPLQGQRRSAIIVHDRVVHHVRNQTFHSFGRSCSIDMSWGGWCLRLVCSHLSSGKSQQQYNNSIDELEQICTSTPLDHYVVIGVDAQAVLGPSSFDDSEFLGEHAESGRSCKGEAFLRFCIAQRMRVLNTFTRDPLGSYTCHYYLKREPRQIDYMCSNLPTSSQARCCIVESSATLTDHRPLLTSIVSRCSAFDPYRGHGQCEQKAFITNPIPGPFQQQRNRSRKFCS